MDKRVRAYLELAGKDADAADLLLAGGNRYSAYHVQQAVEKVVKALLLVRGIEAGSSIGRIPADPSPDILRRDIVVLRGLIDSARRELLSG